MPRCPGMARRRIQRVVADSLMPLTLGVEVAAYRIAVEALTNAVRHSGGRRCCLELTTDQRLRLAVTDDGHGLSSQNGEGWESTRCANVLASSAAGSPSGRPMARGVRVVADLPTLGGVMMHGQRAGCRGHPMFRDALAATLILTGGFEVVATVGSGEDAVAEALRRTPDVVVMNLEMPSAGGVAATAEILRQLPATRILVLTSHDQDRLVYAALRAGAHGYVLKSATTEEIVRAVQVVAQGDGLFSGSVVDVGAIPTAAERG